MAYGASRTVSACCIFFLVNLFNSRFRLGTVVAANLKMKLSTLI